MLFESVRELVPMNPRTFRHFLLNELPTLVQCLFLQEKSFVLLEFRLINMRPPSLTLSNV